MPLTQADGILVRTQMSKLLQQTTTLQDPPGRSHNGHEERVTCHDQAPSKTVDLRVWYQAYEPYALSSRPSLSNQLLDADRVSLRKDNAVAPTFLSTDLKDLLLDISGALRKGAPSLCPCALLDEALCACVVTVWGLVDPGGSSGLGFDLQTVWAVCRLLDSLRFFGRFDMRSHIGQPWITELVLGYGTGKSQQRPAAAQVTEFLPLENWTKEAEHEPAAVVLVSDLKHYIKTVVTKGAKHNLEQEEENYTFNDIKNKIVILRKFNVLLKLELELEDCEFYLVVHELKILPAETGFSDACSCNLDPAVQKKLREFWQNHVHNLTAQSGSFSGNCLSNLIAAVENEDNLLRNTVELCLDLTDNSKASASTSSFLSPSINQATEWKTLSRKEQNTKGIFTIPDTVLMISSNQEEALSNIKEWKDDFVCTEDADSETEQNDDTDVLLHNAEGQEPAPSQNPWNAVSPLCLGGIPSSEETYLSCVSEPCEKHVDKCTGCLSSTFCDIPGCRRQASRLQLSDNSTQDAEESLELYTDGSRQEQPHSEMCAGSPLHALIKSIDSEVTNVTEPEKIPAKPEDNREKSVNHSRTAGNCLFKNISPLSAAADNCSKLNCVGLFKSIAPLTSTAGGSHANVSGSPDTPVLNCTTAARNIVLEADEQQLDGENEECYEMHRGVKRKRQFTDSDHEPHRNKVDLSTGWKCTTVNGAQNSCNVSSDRTFVGTDHFQEIANDVCQVNDTCKESCRKQQDSRDTNLKDTDLRNTSENKMTMEARKCNNLHFLPERPPQQVRDCKRPASSEVPDVQPTESVAASVNLVVSHKTKQDKVRSLRHPDGSQFLYTYPEPTHELISQVNSVRVPCGLLKWAISYLTGPRLTHN
ncbi:uncharacterized protein LOC125459727 [Stegostoma tigrinum]|uniref:uncharacterized protein LOC125459727 n=1 Tax=Stegostoma tigrinum TaxID=3053191 RepID=UPI0028705ACD|nr:uncharacterized protein LOC125459727 [Stegostoma tigrinum]